jgi:hypothetical protein
MARIHVARRILSPHVPRLHREPVGVNVGVAAGALAESQPMKLFGKLGEPGRNRTFNQQIKSLLLCQLSYGPTRGALAPAFLARSRSW